MDVALITAIGALVTALAGSVITLFRIRKERDDRRQQFQTKVAEIEAELLHGRVAQRFKTYPEVFKSSEMSVMFQTQRRSTINHCSKTETSYEILKRAF